MFSTVEQLFYHAEDVDQINRLVELGSLNASGSDAGYQSHQERVARLLHIKNVLGRIGWSHSDLVGRTADILASESQALEWRLPMGESGMLELFLSLLSTQHIPPNLVRPSLRLIGNACADTDENRRFVVEQGYLLPILGQLRIPALVSLVLAVIYNICLDYEPAQRQALEVGSLPTLIDLLSQNPEPHVVQSTCRLLHLLIESPEATDKSLDIAVKVLLQAASAPQLELDQFVTLLDVVVAHLRNPRFQKLLVNDGAVEALLAVLVQSYCRFAEEPATDLDATTPSSGGAPPVARQDAPSEHANILSQTRDKVIEVLPDISALPEFAARYPLHSPLIGSLRLWLTMGQSQLRAGACLMLGNLARSDDVCRVMVHDFKLHEPLIHILRESNDLQLLHAAAGFLKNLTLMAANKQVVGEADLIESVSRLWSLDTLPQIQYSGTCLVRQAVSGSCYNIRRLLAPLSNDPDSPAHSCTHLSLMLHLCEKTDQAATKTEVARTVTAILRVLNSSSNTAAAAATTTTTTTTATESDEIRETRSRLYRLHPDLARPLAFVASQSKRSVVRSEGWFAFALMARSKEGAALVDDALSEIETFRVLLEIVTGKRIVEGVPLQGAAAETTGPLEAEGEPQLANGKEIDRENALVLISQLLQNRGDELPSIRRQIFEDLLHGKEFMHQTFEQIVASASAKLAAEAGDGDDDQQLMGNTDTDNAGPEQFEYPV